MPRKIVAVIALIGVLALAATAPSGAAPGPAAGSTPMALSPGAVPDIARGKIAFSFYNLGRQAYEVQIVTVDGKERWIVTDEQSVSEPRLSPDGQRVAVRGWDRYRGLESFDLHGKNQAGISGHHEDSHVDWAEGDTFVYGSQQEKDRLWRLYVNGEPLKWNDRALIGEGPSWSPKEAYIVYRGCDFDLNNCGLRTVERGGGRPQILTVDSTDTAPAWSRGGKSIAFMSKRTGNWDLYTLAMGPDGRLAPDAEPVAITREPSNEALPAWSPWGDALAFVSDRGGGWAVYIMRPDGSDVRKVADIGGTYDPPLWTPYGGRGLTNEQISWGK
jgi:Tol biopolymer transport system component